MSKVVTSNVSKVFFPSILLSIKCVLNNGQLYTTTIKVQTKILLFNLKQPPNNDFLSQMDTFFRVVEGKYDYTKIFFRKKAIYVWICLSSWTDELHQRIQEREMKKLERHYVTSTDLRDWDKTEDDVTWHNPVMEIPLTLILHNPWCQNSNGVTLASISRGQFYLSFCTKRNLVFGTKDAIQVY